MRSTFILLLIVTLLSACSDVEKPQQAEGMSQFATSDEFQNAHEEPGNLDFTITAQSSLLEAHRFLLPN